MIKIYRVKNTKGGVKKSSQALSFLILSLCLLTVPKFSFGFSSAELDSLEASGEKSLSKSPWRTEIDVSLHRNMELNILYAKQQTYVNVLASDQKDSIYDNWAYALTLSLNYSLRSLQHSFLKKTELFLIASFDEPFKGYQPNIANRWQNFHYGFKDIRVGITAPVYKTENFFSDVSIILIPLPVLSLINENLHISRFSKEATFLGSTGIAASLLYFLQKEENWSLAVSSGHKATYRDFKEDNIEKSESNVYIATMNIASLLFRQSQIMYLPSSSSLNAGYDFALNRDSVMQDIVTMGLSLSWKIQKQMYFSFSVKWRDIWHRSDKEGNELRKYKEFKWFRRDRTIFSLGGSYTF